ncbi:MAG: [protein-PII] uridylyltransferase [Puniceicoccaceae bacterium]|nr:MAG: [protein-PII] uridylyltransferase [Puniceicoccaceae bacterium]
MAERLLKHADHRLPLGDLSTKARRLAACKRFHKLETEMIAMRHRAGESGLTIVRALSAVIDILLTRLFDFAIERYAAEHPGEAPQVNLVAIGGYGRGELSPQSDLDAMFLFPSRGRGRDKFKPMEEILTDEILYILWDMGLTVGHSFRTIDEAFEQARQDIQVKTSLLEARHVAGPPSLFATFEQANQNFIQRDNPKAYIEARLQDQAARRAKHSDTVFLQEPDIKNGVGGLRDYQNILWMARVKLGIRRVEDLHALNYLTAAELKELTRGYEFLLRVRNDLHFNSRRATDLLSLDVQPRLAHRLGYDQRQVIERVEAFMRDYYSHARAIYRITRILEHRLALAPAENDKPRVTFREVLRSRRRDKVKRLDGFLIRGRQLSFEEESVFQEDPVRLIRVFRHCQQLNLRLDFELEALIRSSLPRLTRRIVRSSEANKSFRSILQTSGSVFPTLSSMHECGVLGKFVPEWDKLTCLVQHEFYHRYTADVHTLNTIRELDLVFTSSEPLYVKYREILHETSIPNLLYLILLLHDIGKARGIDNHCQAGVTIARPILRRLEISPAHQEKILFLIKNHLEMARFWQRYDLDDPRSTEAFAELVEDPEKLRLLAVHTFCDSRGTAASLWNSYKDTLHTSLFRNTLAHFESGPPGPGGDAAQLEMIKNDLLSRKIPGVSEEEVLAHFNLLPERYFIHTGNEEIILHLQMVNRLLKSINQADTVGSLRPVIDWVDDLNRSITAVDIVTWDRAGLFYRLAGAFSVAGLNILSARIISRADHIAIDTFYVVEPGRGIVQSQKAREAFEANVEQALVANKDLYPEILKQAKKLQDSLLRPSGTPLQESFPATVHVYHELSLKRNIVEIQACDQIGLLYLLSKTIYDHGFDITFARINTERGVAIDTFYIESTQPEDESEETARLLELREALTRIISPDTAQAVHY